MRTTVDLPDDLHRIATSLARDRRTTLSATIADLMRRGLDNGSTIDVSPGELPALHLGRTITADDVRALEDDG